MVWSYSCLSSTQVISQEIGIAAIVLNEAIAPIERITNNVCRKLWLSHLRAAQYSSCLIRHWVWGSAVDSPVKSGAKPRPLLILVLFGPCCDASPWRRRQLCKFSKKILVSSVAVGLFHEWAWCCSINSTHLNPALTARRRHLCYTIMLLPLSVYSSTPCLYLGCLYVRRIAWKWWEYVTTRRNVVQNMLVA